MKLYSSRWLWPMALLVTALGLVQFGSSRSTSDHLARRWRRVKRGLSIEGHIPEIGVPTFRRDAVESAPLHVSERSFLLRDDFGSRSLPLRAAVETKPDVIASTRRLPLRDAVQSTPSSSTSNDNNYHFVDKTATFKRPAYHPRYRPIFLQEPFSYLRSQLSPQGHYAVSSGLINSNYYIGQTYYQPVQQFQSILANYRSAAHPYILDNQHQQLLYGFTPYSSIYSDVNYRVGRSRKDDVKEGRSLYGNRPFLRDRYSESDRQPQEHEVETKKVICYVQGAAVYRRQPLTFAPEDLDPNLCTHVIYAFATVDPHTFRLVPNDEEYDAVQGGYLSVTGLKLKNPKLKVLISIGGGRKDMAHRFQQLIASSVNRRTFIKSVLEFLNEYNFDGIDLHWHSPGYEEYGGTRSDREQLAVLLEELSEVIRPLGHLLTVAAPASRFRIEDGFQPQRLGEVIDWVHVQAYDFHNDRNFGHTSNDPDTNRTNLADHHSPLYTRTEDTGMDIFFSADYAVRYWLKRGLPKHKLILGIPLFGRAFTLEDMDFDGSGDGRRRYTVIGPGREGYYTQHPGFLAYFEVCELVINRRLQRFVDSSGSPYVTYEDQWVGYDDPESVEKKVAYVKDMGLGGVFVLAADLDDFRGLCGDKWPVLTTIKRNLLDIGISPFDRNALMKKELFGTSYSGFNSKWEAIGPVQVNYVNKVSSRWNDQVKNAAKMPRVACYLTNWAFYRKAEGKFVPEHVDQRLCTHVVYAFASLDTESLLMKEFDPWADLDNNLYSRVTGLRDTTILLSLGGWTDSAGGKYSRLVGDGSARRKFVLGAVAFLRRHHFHGLHFDWNYPVCWQSNCRKGPVTDRPNFTKLIQELRAEFDKESPPLELAIAISGYKEVIDEAYELAALGRAADFLSVMTYDYHGSWEGVTGHVSPLYERPGDKYPQYNTNFTMEYLVSRGAPREKLLLGVPFYGQTFTLAVHDGDYELGARTSGPGTEGEYTRQPGMLAYYEICGRVRNQRWMVERQDGASYAFNRDQWVGYDDVENIESKGKYIKAQGFGGAVAWTIDLDDFGNRCCGGTYPLLHGLNRGLGRISDNGVQQHTVGDCTRPPEPVTPPAPTLTTGVDTGASVSPSTESSWQENTNKPTESTPWWTPEKTTTTTTTQRTTTTTTRRTTTTKRTPALTKPSTTPPWWTQGTTIPPPGVIMPEVEKPGQTEQCEAGTYRADPHNCNAYYRCVLGELKKNYCAGGLHWNNERSSCDWPMNANCQEKPHEIVLPVTTTSTTTTTTTEKPIAVDINDGPSSDDSMPAHCNNGNYYPHEKCNSFYICVNGQLIRQQCAPGLQWSVEDMACDWKHRINCTGRRNLAMTFMREKLGYFAEEVRSGDGKEPHSPCDTGSASFASYRADCTQYLICMWDKYEPFKCAPGLHWNSEHKICDWPANAKCNSDGSVEVGEPTKPKPTVKPPAPVITTVAPPPTVTEPLPTQSGFFKIVCYFTNWAWYRRGFGKYTPENIDPDLCTHIVYGFAVLDYENLVIKAHDSWADFDNKFYERVTDFKSKGLKVTLAIGGWNDSQGDKYSRLVNNPAARERFIKHVIEFLEKYNFDGLDLDWEYPKCWQVDCKKGPSSDKPAFAAWVRELKAAFAPRNLLLSAAVSPSKTVIDAGYDVPSLAKDLDWIAVMTYDFHGQWDKKTGHVAPLYEHPDDDVTFFNANYSINYWISEGVPRRKIIMGMPLYGQSFQLEREINHGLNAAAPGPGQAGEFTRAAGFLAYYEICDKISHEGWTVVQDEKNRLGPYAYKGNQWVSYDDQPMIVRKSEYIRRMNLGGGMIWALDLDDFSNRCGEGKHPLLSTIRRILAAPGVEGVVSETPVVPAIEGDTGTNISEDEEIHHHHEHPSVTVPSREDEVTSGGGGLVVPTLGGATDGKHEYKVVCYFTNWAWYRQGVGKYTPENIDPDLCTHIVYGFAVLNGDQLVIKPHDTWADFDNKFYEKVTALRDTGIKVLIAIGGWNDSAGDKYSKLVNNPSARRRFIAHVVDFIRDNNFDGLDLDWEYPKCWQVDCNKGPTSDKSAFAAWVSELREAFAPHGWLLSAAVSPSRRVIDAGYDVPALSRDLDWIAVMCYDYHGQWDKVTGHVAPMYPHPDDADVTFNTNFTIHYWIGRGADRKKLVLGMPMYGQSFSLADVRDTGSNAPTYGGGEAGEETRARGFLAYYEICANIKQRGWNVVQDRKGRIGPYAHKGDQWVSYDDQAMIRHKSEYVRAMGLGGGMIWALDLDDFRNVCDCEEYPLLRTINRILRGYNKHQERNCSLGGSQGEHHDPTKTPSVVQTEESDKDNSADDVGMVNNNAVEQSLSPPSNPDIIESGVDADTNEKCSDGSLFKAHPTNCQQYYMCNQGNKELYSCPGGLYWNQDRCDWPVNTPCHMGEVQPVRPVQPQVTTTTSTITTTRRPPRPIFPSAEGQYKVVCYFTNWAWYRQGDGKYLPSDIDTDLCTHITYGFAVLDGSTLTIKPHDTWADIDNEFYKKVVALQSKGVKVLIAIGGWNDSLGDKYSRLVNDPSARAKFIQHVVQFIEEWGFDGLDLDWEYPKCWQVDCNKGPDYDKPAFASWVRELSAAFKPRGLLLSTAVSPSKMVIDAGYDVPSLSRDFDWIAVMTYDFHGHWDKKTGHVAPLYYYPGDTYDYFNANFSLHYWIEKGADSRKIIMGMPLYGQSFSLADSNNHGLNAPTYGPGEAGDFTRAGGFLAFYEICERVKRKSWLVVRDPLGRIGPYAYSGQQWVGYDDVAEIRRKSGLVKELGLGGGMVWALDLDDFRNRCGCGRHPLLRTLAYELNGSPPNSPTIDCT